MESHLIQQEFIEPTDYIRSQAEGIVMEQIADGMTDENWAELFCQAIGPDNDRWERCLPTIRRLYQSMDHKALGILISNMLNVYLAEAFEDRIDEAANDIADGHESY